MSTEHSIILSFFDINGEYREDVEVEKQQNFLHLESPIRILDQYINENLCYDLKKITDVQFIIQYKFSYEMYKNVLISINIDIINNFSVSYQRSLEANGYIVFCNLESETTIELLEKIIEYIRDNCSINSKTYIIGVFKEYINEDKSFDKMNEFLSKLDFDFDYLEMYLGDKEYFENISKNYPNAQKMKEVFTYIFKRIYEKRKPKMSKKVKDKNYKQDRSRCIII